MEKSGHSANYPLMPTEMQEATHTDHNSQALAGPPSYDQAIHTTTPYSPNANLTASAPTAEAHTQHNNYQSGDTQYGANNLGGYGNGGGGSGGVPPTSLRQMREYATKPRVASQPMAQQPVVIIQQSAILPLGPNPTTVTCPGCHIQKLTRVDHEPSARTHLMAAILCIVGLWCCVCVPYCAESCMSANHYCGNCNKFLGTYNGGGF